MVPFGEKPNGGSYTQPVNADFKNSFVSFFGITQSITLPKNGHLIEAEEQFSNERLFENICSCEPMNLMVRSERAANERVHQSVLMVRDHDHRNTCAGD